MWEGRYSVVVEEKKLSSAAVQYCNKRRIALCFEGWRVFIEQRRESHILNGRQVQLCINHNTYLYVCISLLMHNYILIILIHRKLLMLSKILIVHGAIFSTLLLHVYNC